VYVALKIREADPRKKISTRTWRAIIRAGETLDELLPLHPDYDQFSNLPDWAKETLKSTSDAREYVYTREQFENAETHDEYWNAAMNEMRHTATCTTT
jgi:deoxyribodipyrimidine photo-lyase